MMKLMNTEAIFSAMRISNQSMLCIHLDQYNKWVTAFAQNSANEAKKGWFAEFKVSDRCFASLFDYGKTDRIMFRDESLCDPVFTRTL